MSACERVFVCAARFHTRSGTFAFERLSVCVIISCRARKEDTRQGDRKSNETIKKTVYATRGPREKGNRRGEGGILAS